MLFVFKRLIGSENLSKSSSFLRNITKPPAQLAGKKAQTDGPGIYIF